MFWIGVWEVIGVFEISVFGLGGVLLFVFFSLVSVIFVVISVLVELLWENGVVVFLVFGVVVVVLFNGIVIWWVCYWNLNCEV